MERRGRDHLVEVCATVLVGLGAVATSWSGYQSTLWNGTQAREAMVAGGMRVCATRASTAAGQARTLDVLTFVSWLTARSGGDQRLAAYYERHVRPEFGPAFHAWLAAHRDGDSSAPAVPFGMSQYRVAADAEVARCDSAATLAGNASQYANAASDHYMLATVIFAVVLFFAGGISDARARSIQLTLLCMSVAACIAGLIFISRLPRGS